MDGARAVCSGKIWIYRAASGEVTIKEHGHICPWNGYFEARISPPFLLLLSRNVTLPPQVVTGRRPFMHTSRETPVIQRVQSGIRPDRPTVGFSDALWMSLTQTWLEEFESSDSPSARPDVMDIIGQLQAEAKNWNPTSRPLSPTIPMERKASCMSSVSSELAYVQLTQSSKWRIRLSPSGFRINLWNTRVCFLLLCS